RAGRGAGASRGTASGGNARSPAAMGRTSRSPRRRGDETPSTGGAVDCAGAACPPRRPAPRPSPMHRPRRLAARASRGTMQPMPTAAPTATDPVCGMTVDVERDHPTHEHAGETFHFCSTGCRDRFRAAPERFLGERPGDAHDHRAHAAPTPPPPPGDAEIWTCPMHPEVRQSGPGTCPKCGMALEPVLGATQDDHEYRDMRRRTIAAAFMTLPVVAAALGDMVLPGEPIARALPHRASELLQLGLTALVVFWAGWPLIERFFASLRNRSPNMFTLIGLGVLVAFGYSAVA